ncbi:D-2-hydroxyacid dehydrogenase [Candidimonas nitroreducens]|uniref:Hydroxyacid dehydrogenase n=1 Tax=Candidimonas nitroreducens TaxID=683354 RepID=A0A225MKJ5_9BURK|nr:D-2-hydroxyacid dehydrogenase [Candidimonas nitroreducens]OWT60051.1 hydroxyacid dehydrogenase [Candidimonas nitroreducens]
MQHKKVRLLASHQALRLLEARHPDAWSRYVEAAVPYTEGERIEAAVLDTADVAFLSRDITGKSTKHTVLPILELFSDMLCAGAGLRWVHTHSAGIDRHFYADLKRRGMTITTSTGSNAGVVAQSVLAAVLALNRRFRLLEQAQRDKVWRPLLGELMPRDLAGQKAVIVGWGAIGRKVADYLHMLGMEITVVRHSAVAPGRGAEDPVAAMISYDELRRSAPPYDWVILACPLTETTRGLIDADFLRRLPDTAHLVNVSRGDVVDEAALLEALESRRLAGAFLDVYTHEPLRPDSRLWGLDNVIVSPHSAGHSDGNYGRVADIFVRNLERWCLDQPLLNIAL